MKTNLKKLLGSMSLGLMLLTNTAPTWAGARVSSEVIMTNTSASGTMAAVSYSADTVQYIGCSSGTNPIFNGSFMQCFARSRSGAFLTCVSQLQSMINAVSAIGDSSYIGFTTGGGSGQCTSVDINSSSVYLR